MAHIVLCVIVWRILASVRERRRDVCVGVCGFEKWREKVEPATTSSASGFGHSDTWGLRECADFPGKLEDVSISVQNSKIFYVGVSTKYGERRKAKLFEIF